MTAQLKRTKPAHEESVDAFYLTNALTVKQGKDSVKEHKGKGHKSGEIANLMKYDFWNFTNWELQKYRRESIGLSRYDSTIDVPLIHEFPKDQHPRIYNEIADSFYTGIPAPYISAVENGIIINALRPHRANETILEDNVKRAESFLESVGKTAKIHIEGSTGTQNALERMAVIKGDIDDGISTKEEQIVEKKTKLKELNTRIETLNGLIDGRIKGDADTLAEEPAPNPITEIAKVIFSEVANIFLFLSRPFVFVAHKLWEALGGFFLWLGARFGMFASFVRKVSVQPAFWISVICFGATSFFIYRLFNHMFADKAYVIAFTATYAAIFSILPFAASKHLSELDESRGGFVTKVRLAFDLLLVAVAGTYTLMAILNRQIYTAHEETQLFAGIAMGIIPFLISIPVGLINYRRLKGDADKDDFLTEIGDVDSGEENAQEEIVIKDLTVKTIEGEVICNESF